MGYIGYFLYIATFSWITILGFNFFWNISSGLQPYDSCYRSDSSYGFPIQIATAPGNSTSSHIRLLYFFCNFFPQVFWRWYCCSCWPRSSWIYHGLMMTLLHIGRLSLLSPLLSSGYLLLLLTWSGLSPGTTPQPSTLTTPAWEFPRLLDLDSRFFWPPSLLPSMPFSLSTKG